MTVATFYDRSRWRSRWGALDAAHPTRHKGLDIAASAREAIPALRPGRVVVSKVSSIVGRYITVEVAPGDYDTYCHVVFPLNVGDPVARGQTIAYAAGYTDIHGTAWTGPHLHFAHSTTPTGWASWGGTNTNPETIVTTALLAAAGLGTTPLEDPMESRLLNVTDTSGKTVKKGEYYYHRDGVTPIAGPISGAADITKFGGVYWLHTVMGVPITAIGGATLEAYMDDQAARSFADSPVPGEFTIELSGKAQPA